MEEKMKKVGMEMNICMGLLMSFCLSLVGMLTGGHFAILSYIKNFVVSVVISLIIGSFIPMGRLTAFLSSKMGLEKGSLMSRFFESFVSNTIYTPIMTFANVVLAYINVKKQSGGMAQISLFKMYLPALIICYIVGYVLIFAFQPLLLKKLMAANGVKM